MNRLPPSLLDAFALAAGELGMFSAARLFCEQMLASGGQELVAAMRDVIGPSYPVLDVVATSIVDGGSLPNPDPAPVIEELHGLGRVVVVGNEACVLDALVDRLASSVELGIVLDLSLPVNAARVAANFEGRATLVPIEEVIHWSGSRTALLTAVYGTDGHKAAVCTAWLRTMGPDTRTCFGAFVGWNLLGPAMEAYPRWLHETTPTEFTSLISPELEA